MKIYRARIKKIVGKVKNCTFLLAKTKDNIKSLMDLAVRKKKLPHIHYSFFFICSNLITNNMLYERVKIKSGNPMSNSVRRATTRVRVGSSGHEAQRSASCKSVVH